MPISTDALSLPLSSFHRRIQTLPDSLKSISSFHVCWSAMERCMGGEINHTSPY